MPLDIAALGAGALFGGDEAAAVGGDMLAGLAGDATSGAIISEMGGSMFDGIPSWLTSAAGNIGSSLFSSAGGIAGQLATNQANATLAQQTRDWSAQQASITRDWEQNLSDTAMTRRVADLKNAGINPMLAYPQGGASTPGVGIASGPTATFQNPILAGTTSAAQVADATSKYVTNKLTNAQVEKTNAETTQTLSSAGELDARRAQIQQEMTGFDTRIKKVAAEILETTQGAALKGAQRELTLQDALKVIREHSEVLPAQTAELTARARKLDAEADIVNLHKPEALREYNLFSGPDGEDATYFKYAPKNLTSAAAGALGSFGAKTRRFFNQPSGPGAGYQETLQ